MGGTEMGDDFTGYGPARVFPPAEVQRIAPLLEWHPERFDPSEMTDVYPSGWDAEPDALEWLHDAFNRLQAFYATAAERGSAVIAVLV